MLSKMIHRSTLPAERQSLRRNLLARRDALPSQERHHLSRIVCERLWQLPEFARASLVFTYVSFRSEVETLALIRRCLAAGKQVTVPLTLTHPPELKAIRVVDVDRDLSPGYCGILEPDPERLPETDPEVIEIIILPGAVFDRQGGRLGYGGGYYDRFLAVAAPAALRIGLAFELQVIEKVPTEAHDQPIDFLITEKGITRIVGSRPRPADRGADR
jgi:5-formyltetrahydrofolate cyclo-ligase